MIRICPEKTQGILSKIGDTPLVEFQRYLASDDVRLLVKLESFNPGGSAKDRPALRMIEDALATKLIDQRSTIVESSSGNMGIGLAQACRYYELPFVCVVDPYAQAQNVAIMRALGATIESVDEPVNGSLLAARWERVQTLINEITDAWWPNQYANIQNPNSHYHGTIREIDEALAGDFDYLFVATSSTGTAQGCQNYLTAMNRRAKVIAIDAFGSSLFGGKVGLRKIPGLGAGIVPPLAHGQIFSQVKRVTDLDCVVGCRRAAAREAILIGGSSGGVLESVQKMSSQLAGKTCVAILHDSGTRYLDTVFSDEWVKKELGCGPNRLAKLVSWNPETTRTQASVQTSRKSKIFSPNVEIGCGKGTMSSSVPKKSAVIE